MSNNFSFNAPTYYDFNPQTLNENDEAVEMYFEIDHECVSSAIPSTCDPLSIDITDQYVCPTTHEEIIKDTKHRDSGSSEDNLKTKFSQSVDDSKVDYEFNTPTAEIYSEISDAETENAPTLRKSLSLVNLADLVSITSKNASAQPGISATTAYPFKRSISVSKERINQLAQPKPMCNNYVSTAEQVNNFFRTKPNRPEDVCKKSKILTTTKPQSPALHTKRRQRETHILPTEEMEKLEIDEYRKLHMKALPLNPRILEGPMKVSHAYKKPATIVKPFNLTETNYANKPMQKHQEVQKPNSQVQATKIGTPQPFKPVQTRPMPFSFELRDKQVAQRRQQKINQILEEEMKARQFRANPPPKYKLTNGVKKSSSLNSLKSIRSEDDCKEGSKQFKARPAKVLYQKPFEPKKPERPLVEVTEFCLNTERRSKNREEYEKKIQEKRDRLEMERARIEEQRARYEKEEIAKLRKEIVHTAKPIRQYKEVKVEPCGKVTVPISPNFRAGKRIDSHNKEN